MQTTELDDLKAVWQTLNRSVERQNSLTMNQLREKKLTGFRAALRWLWTGKVIQLVCGVLLTAASARFWVGHLGVVHLMVYGISLQLYGLLLTIFAGRDFTLISRLDYGAPVVALQKRIAELRQWHLQAAIWFGIASSFIWIPAMLVVFYELGADVWLRSPGVVGWFVASGLLTAAVFGGIVQYVVNSRGGTLAKNLVDHSVGHTLNRAQAMLAEVDRFERDF
jgi:hypothetical protein